MTHSSKFFGVRTVVSFGRNNVVTTPPWGVAAPQAASPSAKRARVVEATMVCSKSVARSRGGIGCPINVCVAYYYGSIVLARSRTAGPL